MDLNIDRNATGSVVRQLVASVTEWIHSHGIRAGARMPSIRQLATENGLSLSSVIKAYDQLVAGGVLESRHGSGFFVAQQMSQASAPQAEDEATAWPLFDNASTQLKLGVRLAARRVARRHRPGPGDPPGGAQRQSGAVQLQHAVGLG
jgi:DNA-binding transcriptional regulator YhcF (GntR family)